MKAPQIIMVSLLALSFGITLANHKKPKIGEDNAWISLIGLIIQIALLWWGGFFN